MSTLIAVSVGTDHHPFDRLISYVSSWLEESGPAEVVVQHGTSKPLLGAENHTILGRERLAHCFMRATALVTQVGPGTILGANALGRRPIIMPRDAARGEHVDNHQLTFGRMMDELGNAVMVQTEEELHAALDRAVLDRGFTRMPKRISPAQLTGQRLGAEVGAVMERRAPRWPSITKAVFMIRAPRA